MWSLRWALVTQILRLRREWSRSSTRRLHVPLRVWRPRGLRLLLLSRWSLARTFFWRTIVLRKGRRNRRSAEPLLRQLQNEITRIAALSSGAPVSVEDLQLPEERPIPAAAGSLSGRTLESLEEQAIQLQGLQQTQADILRELQGLVRLAHQRGLGGSLPPSASLRQPSASDLENALGQ